MDYGDRRVGLAVSDELGIAAHGLPTAAVKSVDEALDAVIQAAKQRAVSRIVIGLPLNMDGSKGPRALLTDDFRGRLEAALRTEGCEVPVEMLDERLTTMRARASLREQGINERNQRAKVDRVSAVVLLQDYLAAHASPGTSDER